jgi:hypothetical protein
MISEALRQELYEILKEEFDMDLTATEVAEISEMLLGYFDTLIKTLNDKQL